MLVRFNESVRVRLWGRQLHNFRKGEVHNVSTAIAAVLFAQRFAEPVAKPPVVPKAEACAVPKAEACAVPKAEACAA